MRTQMLIGRILILIISIAVAYYVAFRQTPELDNVENRWVYRVSYGMLILRALGFIAFDSFGLFPLE